MQSFSINFVINPKAPRVTYSLNVLAHPRNLTNSPFCFLI